MKILHEDEEYHYRTVLNIRRKKIQKQARRIARLRATIARLEQEIERLRNERS